MRHVALVAAAIALAVLAVAPGYSMAGPKGTIQSLGGGAYTVSSEFFAFNLAGADTLSINYFGTSDGGDTPTYRVVFDAIDIPAFSRSEEPRFEGGVVVVEGATGTLEVHSSPLASFDLRTDIQNVVTLQLAGDLGVLPRGDRAVLGDATLTAELVVQGDGSINKAGNVLSADLAGGDRLLFRNAFLRHELGEHIRSGRLAAETYVSSDAEGATLDVMFYQDLALTLDASSAVRKAFTISGDLEGPRVLVFNLARDDFSVSPTELAVSYDGAVMERVDSVDVVMEDGGPAFAAFESPQVLQVFVRVPGFSVHTLVLEAVGPTPVSYAVPLGLAAAVAITLAAAVYLFRPED